MISNVLYPKFKKEEPDDYQFICNCGCSQFQFINNNYLECYECDDLHLLKDIMELGYE